VRDQTILKALKARDAIAKGQDEELRGLYRAMNAFMEMPLIERLGWTLFGARWLVKRWSKRANPTGD
jgi:hypothetical protein